MTQCVNTMRIKKWQIYFVNFQKYFFLFLCSEQFKLICYIVWVFPRNSIYQHDYLKYFKTLHLWSAGGMFQQAINVDDLKTDSLLAPSEWKHSDTDTWYLFTRDPEKQPHPDIAAVHNRRKQFEWFSNGFRCTVFGCRHTLGKSFHCRDSK